MGLPVVGTGMAALLLTSAIQAEHGLNMTPAVTPISQEIYSLRMLIFGICVVIGVAVFSVMAWSIIYHRKSRGAVAANFHESITVEIAWTVMPLLILIAIAIAVPATGTLLDLEDARTNADITVQVTGIQWKWKYTFIDEEVSFVSSLAQSSRDVIKDPGGNENYLLEVGKPLVLPVGKKIRSLFHSSDVIHSWSVPELAVKQDSIPGFMPIVVNAVSEPEYKEWLAGMKAEAAAAASTADQEWSMQDLPVNEVVASRDSNSAAGTAFEYR
ncbi:MAG: cytochrome c oxidase subunit II [Gammaproteobacteria bacterium]|nr:cytochrome c oxidase subunit II [Gammaproteobacteria bacterium]